MISYSQTPTTECGYEMAPCCDTEPRCRAPLMSCDGGICTYRSECGDDGQLCCPPDKCKAGAACVEGRCTTVCGEPGQPCCAGDNPCSESIACGVDGMCPQCGDNGQPCCMGERCNAENMCLGGQCQACGMEGLACCLGNCYDGSQCSSTTLRCMYT